jgi:hypothetical protein
MTDTGPAKRPGLPALRTGDARIDAWASKVAEHIELSTGSRGNKLERSVTVRDLLAATQDLRLLRADKSNVGGTDMVLQLGGGLTVSVAIDAFAKKVFESPLYKSLIKRLDDQSRFDDVPEEVRKLLLVDIATLAARQGAEVVRLEKKIQTSIQSLAYTVEAVTASIEGVSAGVQETAYASASANVATAGRVTQVQARLDNFNGGDAGTATVEQKMSTIASNVTGLSAEYMTKVQAGGIFGGYALSAHLPADPSKPGYSAFIIAVDQFAVVFPGNVGGADAKRIPFGIDAEGVYFNSDVYLKGNMRIEGGQKTLIAGLRGSLSIGITGAGWSDSAARQAIWTALGNGGSATTNNHLVIGDSVTVTSSANPTSGTTKYWNDTSWSVPGVVVTGDMVLDGAFAATKIDTRGLTIKDASGNVIFGSGVDLSVNYINGLGALATQNNVDYTGVTGTKPPANADNTASNTAAGISGQGALATQNYVNVGSTVRFPNGSVMETGDFVSRLSRINSATISTFIDGAAITNAYIGNAAIKSANIENAAVQTLNLAGAAVTVPLSVQGGQFIGQGMGTYETINYGRMFLDERGIIYANIIASQAYGQGLRNSLLWLRVQDSEGRVYESVQGGQAVVPSPAVAVSGMCAPGWITISSSYSGEDAGVRINSSTLFVIGAKR